MNEVLLYSNILLWLAVLLIGFTLFIIFRQFGEVYLSTGESIARDGIAIGERAPSLSHRKTWNGQPVLSQGAKPVLLAFLSPACKVCIDLIPDWNQAVHQHRAIHFRAILVGDRPSSEKILQEQALEGEVLFDEDQGILGEYRVRVTPFALIMDEGGVVRGKGLCNDTGHIDHLISYLESESVAV
ncbi:methylamine dehydrogenase accessory protein MauD [Kroppenstedtia sanguinis]|uniref:TlpA family protein disulfide reductase n=1 Tax=Kroppenstedtia sanguinis TaxID=1380684 RepID=A0ABW4C4L0_9BACL